MRLHMIKDILLFVALLVGLGTSAVTTARTLTYALGAIDPCQHGYRGAQPGSCTRPLTACPSLGTSTSGHPSC